MIKAQQVQQLRQKTGASMMECKRALVEADGHENKAIEILKKKGEKVAESKLLSRQTKEGIVAAYIHNNQKVGVLLELNCETDFVARNDQFKELAHELCLQIAAMNPKYVRLEDIPEEILAEDRRIFKEQFKDAGKPENVISQIIEGKIKKQNEEICLLSQAYIKDQDKKITDLIKEAITQLGEKIEVRRFVRYEI